MVALSKNTDVNSEVIPEHPIEDGQDTSKSRKVRQILEEKLEQQRLKRELDIWDEEYDDWDEKLE